MQNYPNLNVDLSNCEREPIHIIGRVQPHGFMLILDARSLIVEQASENIYGFLDVAHEQVVGHTLEALATEQEYTLLREQLTEDHGSNPKLLQLQGKKFFGFIHTSDGRLIVECEPFERSNSDMQVMNLSVQYTAFQAELNALDSLSEKADLLVRFVQQMLDYDRVMLYKFDEEWNGEVLADKVKPGIHSYLYHHFPASDIPAQARALLQQKQVRQIPDVAAQAVNIVPYFNPRTGSPANIILSELRNPSEIHLEYLQNMQVQASLSVSILVQGKLWGMIACHHQSPVFVNFWRRQVCQWAAQIFANAILASQEKRDQEMIEGYKMQEQELLRQVEQTGKLEAGLFGEKYNLLNLTGATGAALYFNKKFYTVGQTPDEQALHKLIDWLSATNQEQVFNTRQLAAVFPEAAAYQAQASGLLALEISKYNQEYVLYFKPEIQETRVWAGNPEKPAYTEGMRIHPRKSFERWSEVVKGKSLPWSLNELEIAQVLLKDIIAFILRSQADSLKNLNNDLRVSAEALAAKNKRLEDFAHIITHNLRSPMSNIQGLYNLHVAEPDMDTAAEVIRRIKTVTDNMASTIDDLNLIVKSELSHELPRQKIDLKEVIAKELENLQRIIADTNATVETELLETEFHVPKVYLESIMHNLLSNAIKYRISDRPPAIRIKSWKEESLSCIAVSDNGQGMDMDKVGSKLFNLYTTFHKNKDAKGLGLYLTKVQTEALGGSISVYSTPAVGSTFVVCIKNPIS